jgi:hypothetical protein
LLFGLREALFEGDGGMKRILILSFAAMAIGVLLCADKARSELKDVVFYDDAVVGSGEQYRYVSVYDSPPETTTIKFYGYASRIDTHDSSNVNMYEGALSYGLITHNSSTINIYTGGSFGENFGGYEFNLYDWSVVNVYEGGGLYGGSGTHLFLYDSSTLNISGGEVWPILFARNSSTTNLYDGKLLLGFCMLDASILNIYGGYVDTFLWNSTAAPGASVNIYGYGFEYAPQGRWMPPIEPDGEGWWVSKLTGHTLDRVPFTYWGIPDPATNPNIHLIPEPNTLVVLGLGAIAVLRKQRRRKEYAKR